MRDLIDNDAAAQYLGIEPNTLEIWRWQGGGPKFVRLSKRCVRYRPEDLDAWVAARVVSSTSEPSQADLEQAEC